MSNATGRVGQQVNAVTGIFMNPVFSVSCSAQGDKNRHFFDVCSSSGVLREI
ncbi:hypothetical protein ECP02989422_4779 [Escherichia coli P0298942.2]|nr:hypothetical protein ECP02989421_5265 [Escherichia coli P0298942.1]ENB46833.1 hypothetical protein ECP029894210_5291 [Escherichia coli P0298942.10]ENB49983.1 hypothetical protein ECP029894212_5267 [Escherichia coli P0298942.12]ENB68859.1 hypothetical protein ECP029894215_5280 [Escherichia coli P0298942.15]ENB69860.1 hypothetical protein ECP02989426_5025 [Escherichia coli P0298942.6]ENB70416.1 hypothetical protein ECP02989427_5233 [Escherichia coli P0298942.7]ENB71262.1 hypothetical protein